MDQSICLDMVYAVNEEGVSALRKVAGSTEEAIGNIIEAETKLQSHMSEYEDVLGPHYASLVSALESLLLELKAAIEPVRTIGEKLREVSDAYEEIIGNDRLNTDGGGTSNGGSFGTGSGISGSGTAWGVVTQTVHREHIPEFSERVAAVQQDVLAGSGQMISERKAQHIVYSIENFSGVVYSRIRNTYNNPNAPQKDIEMRESIDDYTHAAPKFDGTVFRGINVSEEVAQGFLNGQPIDQLGPSSWTTDPGVAEDFSKERHSGGKGQRVIFVLEKNRSGVSITHISSFGKHESEVLAPSGVKYGLDSFHRGQGRTADVIYIHVHEL